MNKTQISIFVRLISVVLLTLTILYAVLYEPSVTTAIAPAQGEAEPGILAEEETKAPAASGEKKDYIKWVDFGITYEALDDAYRYDVDTHGQETELHWIELLAYLACRNGGNFSKYQTADMKEVADRLLSGETTMEALTGDLKYYSYYYEAYSAVLGGMVGEYETEAAAGRPGGEENTGSTTDSPDGEPVWEPHYGLKAFNPIAKYFPYSDSDDFGASRTYGFARKHLGHDMMGQTGTPIIAVESGYVEALGWNQYGGWRIGIRSFDKKRYYYYAHLRQNYPYQQDLAVGSIVTAGDVIGYLGHTGYSTRENVNNIEIPHLHFGMQLIFDESQKEGDNEIWIDTYQIILFLCQNRSETEKVEGTKEWRRVLRMRDPAADSFSPS